MKGVYIIEINNVGVNASSLVKGAFFHETFNLFNQKSFTVYFVEHRKNKSTEMCTNVIEAAKVILKNTIGNDLLKGAC